ncbi:MAG: hypothetical protein K6G60_01175 [Lachnospiraceae bacterium]|nr:hypothetical protein [Lachnospiraceae bacterium]
MKKMTLLAVLVLTLALAACGSRKEDVSPETVSATTPEAAGTSAPTSTPTATPTPEVPFDEEAFIEGLSNFIVNKVGGFYDKTDYSVVVPIILEVDDTDDSDVKIYGSFWLCNCELKGTTLEIVSGGHFPGLIHGEYANGTYTFYGFDMVDSGSNSAKSAKQIFGDMYEDYSKMVSDDEAREKYKIKAFSDYVKKKGIKADAYKDYGCQPVEIQ